MGLKIKAAWVGNDCVGRGETCGKSFGVDLLLYIAQMVAIKCTDAKVYLNGAFDVFRK